MAASSRADGRIWPCVGVVACCLRYHPLEHGRNFTRGREGILRSHWQQRQILEQDTISQADSPGWIKELFFLKLDSSTLQESNEIVSTFLKHYHYYLHDDAVKQSKLQRAWKIFRFVFCGDEKYSGALKLSLADELHTHNLDAIMPGHVEILSLDKFCMEITIVIIF